MHKQCTSITTFAYHTVVPLYKSGWLRLPQHFSHLKNWKVAVAVTEDLRKSQKPGEGNRKGW